jgi:hypothetical protein
MQLPSMLQGEQRTRLIQGAVVGSLLTMVVGFGFSGWQMQTNVERRTEAAVTTAVVAALTPICVDKFRQAADAKTTLVALNAVDSWKRDGFVEEGGWATFPGSKAPNSDVADACARILSGDTTK